MRSKETNSSRWHCGTCGNLFESRGLARLCPVCGNNRIDESDIPPDIDQKFRKSIGILALFWSLIGLAGILGALTEAFSTGAPAAESLFDGIIGGLVFLLGILAAPPLQSVWAVYVGLAFMYLAASGFAAAYFMGDPELRPTGTQTLVGCLLIWQAHRVIRLSKLSRVARLPHEAGPPIQEPSSKTSSVQE